MTLRVRDDASCFGFRLLTLREPWSEVPVEIRLLIYRALDTVWRKCPFCQKATCPRCTHHVDAKSVQCLDCSARVTVPLDIEVLGRRNEFPVFDPYMISQQLALFDFHQTRPKIGLAHYTTFLAPVVTRPVLMPKKKQRAKNPAAIHLFDCDTCGRAIHVNDKGTVARHGKNYCGKRCATSTRRVY